MKVGQMIGLTLMSQQGRRFETEGEIVDFGKHGPILEVENSEFHSKVRLELIEPLIESEPAGYRYLGDIQGAALVPDNLWKNPKK